MPLTVYHSDRIDDLAADLQRRLLAESEHADPFRFIQVVVPNANIAKWLQTRRFSRVPRLAAGIDFCFVDRFLRERLREALRQAGKLADDAGAAASDSLASRSLTYAVMRALTDPAQADPALAPFYRYVWPPAGGEGPRLAPGTPTGAATARLAWQLAGKLAGLFDLYEARRPEMIADWLSPHAAPTLAKKYRAEPGSVAAAEIALAQKTLGPDGPLPGQSLRQLLQTVKDEGIAPCVDAGQTLYFFGQSTLTKTQAQALHWLTNNGMNDANAVFYYNNVCLEYWADIERRPMPWSQFRDQLDRPDPEIENELLRDWGLAGREAVDILCQMEEGDAGGEREAFRWELCPPAAPDRESAGDAPAPWPASVLAAVQASIRRRTSALAKLPQDDTLQVFGAPGIRREVETVYNAIVAAATGANGTAPCPVCDIAVLVPNMKAYRPYIQAVFDERGEIPYSIVDTTAADFSRCLAGLNALFALWREGLNRDTLFAVLENPLAQATLGYGPDDVHAWRELTNRIGAFTHFDRADAARHAADPEGAANLTWQAALQRLRLSTVAVALPPGALPDVDPARDVLGDGPGLRFSAIVETLWREVSRAFGDAGAPPLRESWTEAFRRLLDAFLNPDAWRRDPEARALESHVRGDVLRTLAAIDAAGLPPHGAEFALEAVNAFAGGAPCDHGGYLTGGVTIAGLLPMRPVPFKLAFVVGLSEGEFPGARGESSLDLRMAGLGAKVRDAALPEINRFLFLETLMATRERLVLSYVNRDTAKDARLFPCGVIRQLEGFLNRWVLTGDGFKEAQAPLLEADQAATAPQAHMGLLATFYDPARRLAQEVPDSPAGAAPAAVGAPAANADAARGLDGAGTPFAVAALAEFLKSPLQGLLLRHFGIAKEYYRAQGLSAETPLAIDMPVQWDMQMELLQKLAATTELQDQAAVDAAATEIFAEIFRDRQRQGAAPGGFIGDFERAARRDATLVPLEFLDFYRQARPENGAGEVAHGAAPLAGAPAPSLPPIDELCAAPVAHDVAVDGDMHAHYPPDRLFAPWLGWLEELANGGRRASFTALVLDFVVPAAATFTWECPQGEAAQTLRGLREAAADYLARPDGEGGKYLTWKYAKLAEAWHKEEGDWGAAAATALAQTDSDWRPDEGGYSSDLVIEQTLAQRVLAPDEIADDLDHLARALAERGETMYGAFLAGVGRVLYTNKKPGKAHGATGGKRQPAAQDKKAPATKARKPRSKA